MRFPENGLGPEGTEIRVVPNIAAKIGPSAPPGGPADAGRPRDEAANDTADSNGTGACCRADRNIQEPLAPGAGGLVAQTPETAAFSANKPL